MKINKIVTFSLAFATLGLGGVVSQTTMPAAHAQDPQAPPPPMDQGPGGPGGGQGGFGGGQGGRRQGGQGFGGGQGGRQGMMAGGGRFALGTVSAVDPAAKTITVTSPFAGTQTIQVSDSTQVVSQATATVADLKVGDKIQVQGVPTGITASTLTIGENPLAAGQGGGRQGGIAGAGGGRQGGGGQGGFGGGQGGPGAQPASASATGTVTSTSPLTISLSTSVTLTLKMASDAKVTRYATVPLSGIKTGDNIVSTGQAGADGTFSATTVGVNMQMGGGQGGRGGFGGGQGGFGGGQGGRGRRGGQGGGGGFGGGQNGGGVPMPAPDPNA